MYDFCTYMCKTTRYIVDSVNHAFLFFVKYHIVLALFTEFITIVSHLLRDNIMWLNIHLEQSNIWN